MNQVTSENLQLNAQLGQCHTGWQRSSETDIVPRDIKLFTELEHFEALGDNIPDGCLFRLLIGSRILESAVTRDECAKHLQLLYLSPSWEQICNIPVTIL